MTGQPPGRFTPWLLMALLAFTCRAAADEIYTLSVWPAWGGHVKPGVPSELGLRLLAPHGGRARLTVHSSRAVVRGDAAFDAGLPLQMHLPLAHDTALPIVVKLAIDGQYIRSERHELRVLPAATVVVAIVNSDVPTDWPGRLIPPAATVLHVAARDLPHSGQAYKLLSGLYLAESALPVLSGEQRQALADYAAGCGLLYLSGVATAQAQALRDVAGCNARNLIVPSLENTALSRPQTIDNLPAAAMLEPLLAQGHDTVLRSLVVFLLGYIAVLLLAVRTARTTAALLMLPLAATALAVSGWFLASPRIQVASLAEMDSGDPVARFAGLLQVTGTAPRDIVLELPAQLGLPSPAAPGQTAEVEIYASGQQLNLHLQAHLMSRHAFRVDGLAPGASLAVASTASGVHVTNHGDTRSASAILAWRGQRYSVPGLTPGQQWRQPQEAETWGRTAPELLLRQRATDGGSWLLMPYTIPALHSLAGDNDSASWLLVRGVADA